MWSFLINYWIANLGLELTEEMFNFDTPSQALTALGITGVYTLGKHYRDNQTKKAKEQKLSISTLNKDDMLRHKHGNETTNRFIGLREIALESTPSLNGFYISTTIQSNEGNNLYHFYFNNRENPMMTITYDKTRHETSVSMVEHRRNELEKIPEFRDVVTDLRKKIERMEAGSPIATSIIQPIKTEKPTDPVHIKAMEIDEKLNQLNGLASQLDIKVAHKVSRTYPGDIQKILSLYDAFEPEQKQKRIPQFLELLAKIEEALEEIKQTLNQEQLDELKRISHVIDEREN